MKISVFRKLIPYGSDDVYQQDSTTFIFRESQVVPFYCTKWRGRPVDPKVHIARRGASNLSLGICVRIDFKQTTRNLQITSLEVLFLVMNFAIGRYPYFTELKSFTAKGLVLAPSLLQLTVRGAMYSWVWEDLPGA
jgi:hypothetical protein